jgi:hypothetical protein
MRHVLIGGAVVAIIACDAGLAVAQVRTDRLQQRTFTETQERIRPNKPSAEGLGALGYVVGDGIVIAPTFQAEGGYDSNPDRLFNGKSTGYGLVDGGVTLGFVNPQGATSFNVRGSFVEYENLDRNDRFDAGVSIDTYRPLGDGREWSGGAFYLHDEVSTTENKTAGAYSEFAFKGETFEGFVTSRYFRVDYFKDAVVPPGVPGFLSPFLLNSAFNVQRFEEQAGVLFGRNHAIGLFLRGGVAEVDYFDQPDQSAIDRDGTDMWGIGGVRLTFSPYFRADLGVRFNRRDLDDKVVSSFSSTGFDGAITWAPSDRFQLRLEADRYIGEPATALARLADVKYYSLVMQWRPIERATLSLRASTKKSEEIGDNVTFDEDKIEGEYAYDLTQGIQVYISALYERTVLEQTDDDYDRFRIGVGSRIRFNDRYLDPITSAAIAGSVKDAPMASEEYGRLRNLSIGVGYSYFDLPSMRMMKRTDGFLTRVLGDVEEHDGDLDGVKIDARLSDFARHRFSDGRTASFDLKGFYGYYEASQNAICDGTGPFGPDCVYLNIKDVHPNGDNNTGPFGLFHTRTKREAHYWGAAVEMNFSHETRSGSLKDEVVVTEPSNWRVGLGVRGLHQKTKLHGEDVNVPDPVKYDEALNTYYYGGFIGYGRTIPLGGGFSLGVSAEGGLYYGDTDYKGRYVAYIPIGPNTYVTDEGRLRLDHNDLAFIGSSKLELNRAFNWGTAGIYGEIEYLSYAPRVYYNDYDRVAGPPFDIVGPVGRTKILSDDAWNATVGARISVPIR